MKKKSIKPSFKIFLSALKEDNFDNDITTKFFVPEVNIDAIIISKSNGILCGINLVKDFLKHFFKKVKMEIYFNDGDKISKNDVIAKLHSTTKIILPIERPILNILQHLSGITTQTYNFIEKTKKYNIGIYDTRKTLPGLRYLQKYAIRVAGGKNHRTNLSESVLIKDNHLKIINDKKVNLQKLISQFRKKFKKTVEIEVQNISQLIDILKLKPDIIMLDNFEPSMLNKALTIIKKTNYKPIVEVSGGIDMKNIKKFLKNDIDRISIGDLTISPPALDFSLEVIKVY